MPLDNGQFMFGLRFSGYAAFFAGLGVGLTNLASGYGAGGGSAGGAVGVLNQMSCDISVVFASGGVAQTAAAGWGSGVASR